jgi:surface polysaccharide O-acyltransferase-like enzyme
VFEIFGEMVTILLMEAGMKKILFWLFVLMAAALNWAALHDILKGEPDIWLEWTCVIVSVLLVVPYIVRKIWKQRFG